MALNFPDSPTVGQVYTDTTSGFSYEWTGSLWKSYSAASASTIKALDDISASFNGTTQTFALTSSGSAVYPVNDQQIIINLGGVIQDPVNDFNISGSNITFTTAPAAGLTFSGTLLGVGVPIDYANSGNVQQRQSYTATAGQTTFTFTPGYNPGYLDVYRNGVRLLSGSDYTATSGTGFTLTVPAQLNDEIEAIGYKVASLVDATGNFINLKATGISTLATTFINGVTTHDANLIVGVGYSVGIGTNNPPYHLTVTEVGASPTPSLSYCIADFTNNINGYSQVNIRNASTAANASGDLVITTDNGTDTTNYIDLGINNSSFSNGSWTINGALDGYLYSSNQNFSIGVAFPDRYLSFFAGGTLAANEKMRVNSNGVGIGTTNPTSALTIDGNVSLTGHQILTGVGNTRQSVYIGSIETEQAPQYKSPNLHSVIIGVGAGSSAVISGIGSWSTIIGAYAGQKNNGYENCFFGNAAGQHSGGGSFNNYYGVGAGVGNTGSYNTFMGEMSGAGAGISNPYYGPSSLYKSNYSIGIGYAAARNGIGSFSTYLGTYAGFKNTSGILAIENVAIGYCAGYSGITGGYNSLVGSFVGYSTVNGTYNSVFGYNAYGGYGGASSSGTENVVIGRSSKLFGGAGSYNTIVGSFGGYYNTGDNNTFIGYAAGYQTASEGGSNNIAIGHYSGYSLFGISGLDNRIVMGNSAHTNAYIQISWTVVSDERDKNITGIVPHGKDFVEKLEPIEYQFKDRETGEVKDTTKRYGFSAQKVLELEGNDSVIVDANSPDKLYLTDSYLIPVLVNAIKDLNKENQDLKKRLERIESHLNLD